MTYQALEQIAPAHILFFVMIGFFVAGTIIAIQLLMLFIGFGAYILRVAVLVFRGKKQTVEKPLDADDEPRRKHSIWVDLKTIGLFFLLLGSAIALAIFCWNVGSEQNDKMLKNEAIVEENIKAKYAVQDVDWEAGQTNAWPFSPAPEDIVVVDEQGQKVLVQYRIDLTNNEPFLSDLPKNSDDPVRSGVSTIPADALLKK